MDTFLSILVDNYIWLIAISVFLLFSLIGYLSENGSNDTIKVPKEKPAKIKKEKPVKIKKEKKPKKEKQKKDDILEDDTPTIGELMKMEEEKRNTNSIEQLDTTSPNVNVLAGNVQNENQETIIK